MDKTETHPQPYPLWASWTEAPGETFAGRVVGWLVAITIDDDGGHPVDDCWLPVVDTGMGAGMRYRSVSSDVTLHDQLPLEHQPRVDRELVLALPVTEDTPGTSAPGDTPGDTPEDTPRQDPGVPAGVECWCSAGGRDIHDHDPGDAFAPCPLVPVLPSS